MSLTCSLNKLYSSLWRNDLNIRLSTQGITDCLWTMWCAATNLQANHSSGINNLLTSMWRYILRWTKECEAMWSNFLMLTKQNYIKLKKPVKNERNSKLYRNCRAFSSSELAMMGLLLYWRRLTLRLCSKWMVRLISGDACLFVFHLHRFPGWFVSWLEQTICVFFFSQLTEVECVVLLELWPCLGDIHQFQKLVLSSTCQLSVTNCTCWQRWSC